MMTALNAQIVLSAIRISCDTHEAYVSISLTKKRLHKDSRRAYSE